VDELLRLLPDCANVEGLLLELVDALVAGRHILFDRGAVRIVPVGSSFDKGDAQVETHHVHVVASLDIVESVDHDVEPAEVLEREPLFLNASDVVSDLDVRVLFAYRLFQGLALRHIYVFATEQELPVEIADVDRVEIND